MRQKKGDGLCWKPLLDSSSSCLPIKRTAVVWEGGYPTLRTLATISYFIISSFPFFTLFNSALFGAFNTQVGQICPRAFSCFAQKNAYN